MKKSKFAGVTFSAFVVCILFAFSAACAQMGDINSDGIVTSADARLVLRAAVGLENFNDEVKALADVNHDGVVTSADARLVLRAAVGLEFLENDEPEHIHSYSDYTVVKNPTCIANGIEKAVCVCGDAVFREIPMLGHDLVHHDEQAATCTEIGWNDYDTCTRCNYTTCAEIPALGHDIVHHDGQAATCTAIGWNDYDTCTRCDYTSYLEIPAPGHDLVHHDGQAAKCTAVGWNDYDTCTRCNYTTCAEIPALGHSYGENKKYDNVSHRKICSVCGDTIYEAHAFSEYSVNSTCIVAGSVTYTCTVCGYAYTVDDAKLAHSWDSGYVSVMPACEQNGERTYTCTVCNTVKIEVIPPTGHTLQILPTVSPDCVTPGLTEGEKCSVCGKFTVAQSSIPAPGHDLVYHDGQAATCTAIGWNDYDTCSRCDYTTYAEISAPGHDIVHHDEQAATCTAIGWNSYDTCSRCDYSTYADISAIGHAYVPTVILPACTAGGYTLNVCSRCSDSYKSAETAPLGHDCIYEHREDGQHICTCTRCEYTLTQSYEWTGKNVIAPTDTARGYTEYSCSVCGEKKYDSFKYKLVINADPNITVTVYLNNRVNKKTTIFNAGAALSFSAVINDVSNFIAGTLYVNGKSVEPKNGKFYYTPSESDEALIVTVKSVKAVTAADFALLPVVLSGEASSCVMCLTDGIEYAVSYGGSDSLPVDMGIYDVTVRIKNNYSFGAMEPVSLGKVFVIPGTVSDGEKDVLRISADCADINNPVVTVDVINANAADNMNLSQYFSSSNYRDDYLTNNVYGKYLAKIKDLYKDSGALNSFMFDLVKYPLGCESLKFVFKQSATALTALRGAKTASVPDNLTDSADIIFDTSVSGSVNIIGCSSSAPLAPALMGTGFKSVLLGLGAVRCSTAYGNYDIPTADDKINELIAYLLDDMGVFKNNKPEDFKSDYENRNNASYSFKVIIGSIAGIHSTITYYYFDDVTGIIYSIQLNFLFSVSVN